MKLQRYDPNGGGGLDRIDGGDWCWADDAEDRIAKLERERDALLWCYRGWRPTSDTRSLQDIVRDYDRRATGKRAAKEAK